ncbi:MAG: ATP-binding protein [Bacteroidales bacterium]|nr:ATP-binding protein [Bacteroidales bacterium]
MKRELYNNLLEWKNSRKRKPLLLQGTRQVGKTFLVNEFGRNEYSDYVYLNFEQSPDLQNLFAAELKPENIITNISLYLGRRISAEGTLLFFDEIQTAPEVLTSLKYFYEQAPQYHIIAAGSLLGVSIGKSSSFPVGKVHFLSMYPMTFIEYLSAFGEELLVETIKKVDPSRPIPDVLHEKLIRHFKLYLFLGGMPEVLQDYLENKDISSARRIQKEILEAYQRDFSKYTANTQVIKTSEIWRSVPRQLSRENKKFKYGEVRRNARAATFGSTIEWLKNAGLINLAYNVATPKLPLSAYADYLKFKIYLHDTGLLGALLKISSNLIVAPTGIFSEFNGAFIENFVAQELTAYGNTELFYWTSKSYAEVDFLLSAQGKIIPLEVKSGSSRKLKSLRSYAEKYKPETVYRASPRNFSKSGDFVNIPLYAVFKLTNL